MTIRHALLVWKWLRVKDHMPSLYCPNRSHNPGSTSSNSRELSSTRGREGSGTGRAPTNRTVALQKY